MNKAIYVTGFQRTGGAIEIMYFETREQSNNAGISRSLILSDNVQEYNKLLDEALEPLEDLIDLALQDIRSPKKSLNPRERISQGVDLDEIEDEDEGDMDE